MFQRLGLTEHTWLNFLLLFQTLLPAAFVQVVFPSDWTEAKSKRMDLKSSQLKVEVGIFVLSRAGDSQLTPVGAGAWISDLHLLSSPSPPHKQPKSVCWAGTAVAHKA